MVGEEDGDWAGTVVGVGTVAVGYRRRRRRKKVVVVVEALIVEFLFVKCSEFSEFEDECFLKYVRVKIKQRKDQITNLSLLFSTILENLGFQSTLSQVIII